MFELVNACLRLGEAAIPKGDTEAVIRWGQRAVERMPEHPGPHHLLAVGLLNGARYAEAESEASRAIELAPENAQVWWLRAMARAQLERVSEGRADAERAVVLDPGDARYQETLAQFKA